MLNIQPYPSLLSPIQPYPTVPTFNARTAEGAKAAPLVFLDEFLSCPSDFPILLRRIL